MNQEKNLDKAVTQTIKDCEQEGIMLDFVHKHGSEAVNMLFTQWNMEDALEVRYEEGLEDGTEKGIMIALIQMVSKKLQKGKSVMEISHEIEETTDIVEQICKAIEDCHSNDAEQIYEYIKTKA